jgi:integrase/recombinase XerD
MRDLIGDFLDAKSVEEGAAQNTLSAYGRDLRQFVKALSPTTIEKISENDVERYLTQLKSKKMTSSTISRKISSIREFYKFLQSESIVNENPAGRLCSPKKGKHLPSFLTSKEIEKLYDVDDSKTKFEIVRMRTMIKLMYSTGMRVSELVALPEDAVNYDLQQILIYGKGCKERFVPVSKEVIKDILFYTEMRKSFIGKGKNKWLFPSTRSLTGHMTRGGFFKSLKTIAVKAGISPDRVHPHILRHSFATRLVNKNVDLRSIQKMLGHENVSTTEIYTHITTQKLADEVRKHHPLVQQAEKIHGDENEK